MLGKKPARRSRGTGTIRIDWLRATPAQRVAASKRMKPIMREAIRELEKKKENQGLQAQRTQAGTSIKDRTQQLPRRKWQHWNEMQDRELRTLHGQGLNHREIARKMREKGHDVDERLIRFRLERLGLRVPVKRKPIGEKIKWTRELDEELRKAVAISTSMHEIAEKMSRHHRLMSEGRINGRMTRLQLDVPKERSVYISKLEPGELQRTVLENVADNVSLNRIARTHGIPVERVREIIKETGFEEIVFGKNKQKIREKLDEIELQLRKLKKYMDSAKRIGQKNGTRILRRHNHYILIRNWLEEQIQLEN